MKELQIRYGRIPGSSERTPVLQLSMSNAMRRSLAETCEGLMSWGPHKNSGEKEANDPCTSDYWYERASKIGSVWTRV